MQSAYRVSKSAEQHGEPAPEGVHQDDATLTVKVKHVLT